MLPSPLAQHVWLLFGAHEVLVEMDSAPAGAHEASDEEVARARPVLERAAAGPRRAACFTRTSAAPSNVLVTAGGSGGGGRCGGRGGGG